MTFWGGGAVGPAAADPHESFCRVCAVSGGDLRSVDARVLSLDPHTIGEIAESVRTLGREFGVAERGRAVADGMLARIERVRERVRGRPRPRVFLAEWLDPPLRAFSCPVVAVNADRFFARPSPAIATGVERLAEIFHGP